VEAPRHLETARLALATPRAEDAEDILNRYAGDERVTRYVGWPMHRSLADTRAFLSFSAQQWEWDGVGPYIIRTRSTGLLLGSTGLGLEPEGVANTGYVLAHDAWDHGYATEALRAMIDLAVGLPLHQIYALCHPAHRASRHVLEKCGFVRDRDRWVEFPNLDPAVHRNAACYIRVL